MTNDNTGPNGITLKWVAILTAAYQCRSDLNLTPSHILESWIEFLEYTDNYKSLTIAKLSPSERRGYAERRWANHIFAEPFRNGKSTSEILARAKHEDPSLRYVHHWPEIVTQAVKENWDFKHILVSWETCWFLAIKKQRKERWHKDCLQYVAEKTWYHHLFHGEFCPILPQTLIWKEFLATRKRLRVYYSSLKAFRAGRKRSFRQRGSTDQKFQNSQETAIAASNLSPEAFHEIFHDLLDELFKECAAENEENIGTLECDKGITKLGSRNKDCSTQTASTKYEQPRAVRWDEIRISGKEKQTSQKSPLAMRGNRAKKTYNLPSLPSQH